MNIWKISIYNIKSKPLYTLLSILMLSLSIGLLLGTQQLKSSFQFQKEHNLGSIDVVLGAKGSPLQLVLSSVLHLDNPTGNIPYKLAEKLGRDPTIKQAVPISYGDNYKGYRIIGTTEEFLGLYNAKFNEGRMMHSSLEAVLGYQVAKQSQLKVGDSFLSSHGLLENNTDVHDSKFVVVGILKPTYTVVDRLILTNLESVWEVHDHEVENHEDHKDHEEETHNDRHDIHKTNEEHHEHHDHDEEKEITSLLISFKNPLALLNFPRKINKTTNMLAVLPKYELDKLFKYTGVGLQTISIIAYIILLISGMIIFISFYKMIKEQAFDLALLRTYGASTMQLIKMLVYEGLIITVLALLIGVFITKFGMHLMLTTFKLGYYESILQELSFFQVLDISGLVIGIMVVSVVLSLYPIIHMNISTILSNEN